jgi:hypothetical protein
MKIMEKHFFKKSKMANKLIMAWLTSVLHFAPYLSQIFIDFQNLNCFEWISTWCWVNSRRWRNLRWRNEVIIFANIHKFRKLHLSRDYFLDHFAIIYLSLWMMFSRKDLIYIFLLLWLNKYWSFFNGKKRKYIYEQKWYSNK